MNGKRTRRAAPTQRGRHETRVSADGDRVNRDRFKRSPSPRQKPSVVKKQREAAALARLKSFAKSVEGEARKLRTQRQQTAPTECDNRTPDRRVSIPGSAEHGKTDRTRGSNATPSRSAIGDPSPSMVGSSMSLQYNRRPSMIGNSIALQYSSGEGLPVDGLPDTGVTSPESIIDEVERSLSEDLQQQVHWA